MYICIYFSTTAKKLYYFDDGNRKMTIPLMICIIMYRQLLLCVSLLDMHVPEVNMWLCRCWWWRYGRCRCFFPEPRKHCHHRQQQKTFSLVGWILLGQCTHNDDDDSIKAMIPAWFFVSCCYYYYICLWKGKGPFLLVYCILLFACMHGALNCWTLEFFLLCSRCCHWW